MKVSPIDAPDCTLPYAALKRPARGGIQMLACIALRTAFISATFFAATTVVGCAKSMGASDFYAKFPAAN